MDISKTEPVPTFQSGAKPAYSYGFFHSVHMPSYNKKHRNCKVCYNDLKLEKKTHISCAAPQCKNEYLCITKNKNCFQKWHSDDFDGVRG